MIETKRQSLSMSDTLQSALVTMSEGNPGALSVLMKFVNEPDCLMVLLHLDDMNIRGPQIWVAYKDHCGEDTEKLREAIVRRDPEMVRRVNQECPEHQAVVGGASFKR